MNRWCSFATTTSFLVGGAFAGTAACGSDGGSSVGPMTDAGSDGAPADAGSTPDSSTNDSASNADGGTSDGALDARVGPTATFVSSYVDARYGSEGRIAVQADGKIVFAGSDVRRYTSDFQPDTSFGNAGIVTMSGAEFFDVALQPDGKIVLAGRRSSVALVARLSGTDGSLDTSFGSSGVAGVPYPYADTQNTSSFNSLALQADGKIVAGGNYTHWLSQVGSGFNNPYAIAARFASNGTLDGSFNASGTAGVVSLAMGSNESQTSVLSTGKILMLGSVTSGTALIRIDADGTMDASFGTNGILDPVGGGAVKGNRMAIQGDGKVVVVSGFGVWRLGPDGSADPSFGANGFSSTQSGSTSVLSGVDVRVDSGGKIVAIGVAGSAQPFKMGVLRLNSDGSRDAALQTGTELGVATLDTPAPYTTSDAQGSSLGFGSDGSIVAAGVVTLMPSFNQMPLLARLK